jgi:NADPH-dependent curcumin reductase CurA
MIGGTVGEVVESRVRRSFAVGDKVVGMGGWQEYSVVDADASPALRKVDTTHVPLSPLPGRGRHAGRHGLVRPGARSCAPKAGETVVVSAATGAVGSAFAALAKARGCRVVGIAGGPDKCRTRTEELGFDACIDYKQHADFKSHVQGPQGSLPGRHRRLFRKRGRLVLDAVMLRMNAFGRIAVCGMIAGYDGAPLPMANPR